MRIKAAFQYTKLSFITAVCSSPSTDIPMMRRRAKKKFSNVADICKANNQPRPALRPSRTRPLLVGDTTTTTNSQITEHCCDIYLSPCTCRTTITAQLGDHTLTAVTRMTAVPCWGGLWRKAHARDCDIAGDVVVGI